MIKTLQLTLKQDKEKFTVPRSVQDTIPIRRIWPDGVFQFGSKFSKTIRFSDINYAIASKEDKTSMFLDYSELLNALDTGSTTKITINNMRLNRQNFEREILLPLRGDELDGFRAEYNGMLMDKVTDSSNSVVQERYVTLSVHKKDVSEARTFFDRVSSDVSTRLNHLGARSEELDAVQRLQVLHDFYRVGEETEFRFDLKDAMRKGGSYKDTICPDSLEFKKDCFVMGKKFGRAMFLKEYASYIKDSMINELTSLNRSMMLSIDVIPVPTDEAVREMQNRLLGVETNVTNWQRRQNSNNNYSAVVPYDLEQQRKETREMLDDLTTRDQRMMFAVVTLVHLADSMEELDNDTEALQSIARKHLCQLNTLNWQQADGLVTALPLGLRRIDALRTLTTEALAVLMPFKAQEVQDRGGVYYGQNAISKNLIIADRKQLLNGNGFVLGVSGSGKSFAAKREMLNLALSTNDDIIVVDPESEYRPLFEGMGGEVIEISATSPNHINALDMEQGYGDGENPVVLKSEFLLSLCEQLVGAGKLSAREKSIIDRCTAQVYRDYIRRGFQGDVPTLKDFHAELLKQPEEEAHGVALAIELFTEGSLNTFAKPTNVDVSSRLLCYDIRDLGKQLQPVGMLVVLDSIFNRVIRNRQLGRNTWIYLDEIYLLFQHEYSANFLFTLWKRVRKYRACATGISQNIEDLLQSHTARTMLANSEFLVMLNQAATDRAELAHLLNISDNQLSYITKAARLQEMPPAERPVRTEPLPIRTKEAVKAAQLQKAPPAEQPVCPDPLPIRTKEAAKEALRRETLPTEHSVRAEPLPIKTKEAVRQSRSGVSEPFAIHVPDSPPKGTETPANVPKQKQPMQIRTREAVRQEAAQATAQDQKISVPIRTREAVRQTVSDGPQIPAKKDIEAAPVKQEVMPYRAASPDRSLPVQRDRTVRERYSKSTDTQIIRENKKSRVPTEKRPRALSGSGKDAPPATIREKRRRPAPKQRRPLEAAAARRRRVKTADRSVRTAQATAKEAAKARVRFQQVRAAAKKAAVTLKKGAEAAAKALKAIIAAAKSLISAIMAGGWVAVVAVLLICMIGLLLASPFGLFFSSEDSGTGTTMPDAVDQLNAAFANRIEEIKENVDYDELDMDNAGSSAMVANWPDVLMIYAVRTSMDADDPDEVATLTAEKLDLLAEVFWDMNAISYWTESVPAEDGLSTKTILHIKITISKATDMAGAYDFTPQQRTMLAELMEPENQEQFMRLTGSYRDISLSAGEISDIVARLPEEVSEERQAVCLTAHQLVGKVGYFWGGKSLVLGWDSRWGTPTTVWAEGSSTTGKVRPFGLDCSGYVDWVFYNATNGAYYPSGGGGTNQQLNNCTRITWSQARPGDLVFYADVSHVGIIAGFDASGQPVISHSSTGGVTLSGASGFSIVARPGYFTD